MSTIVLAVKSATQDGEGRVEYSRYNELGLVVDSGRLLKKTNSSNVTESVFLSQQAYRYNAMGERMSSTNAVGASHFYRYDARGNVVNAVSPTNLMVDTRFDALNRKVFESTSAIIGGARVSKSQSWAYLADGSQTHTDLGNNVTTSTFTAGGSGVTGGLMLSQTNTLGLNQSFSYYSNGWLKQVRAANGSTSTYEYNAAGLRTVEVHKTITQKGEWVTMRIENRYDALGRLVLTRSFDGEDASIARMLSQSAYQYDAEGNRRSITVANGLEGVIAKDLALNPTGKASSYSEGQAVAISLNATGVSPTSTVYQLVGGSLPKGLTFDAVKGTISGTIAPDAVQGVGDHWNSQTFALDLLLKDEIANTQANARFELVVQNRPATWISQNLTPPTLAGKVGQLLSISAGNFSRGPEGNPVAITVTSPAWLRYDAQSNSFTGTPTAAGSFSYDLRISDGSNGTYYRSGTVSVASANSGSTNIPPRVVNALVSKLQTRLVEGAGGYVEDVYFFMATNEAFIDDNGDALTITASGLPASLRLTAVNGGIEIVQASAGARLTDFESTFTLTATDGRGGSAQTSMKIKVTTRVMTNPQFAINSKLLSVESMSADAKMTTMASAGAPEYEPEPPEPIPAPTLAGEVLSFEKAKYQTEWFSYDGANRVLVNHGKLVGQAVGASEGGALTLYNKAGQIAFEINGQSSATKYVYNDMLQLVAVQRSVTTLGADFLQNPAAVKNDGIDWRNISSFEYDAAGRVVAKYTHYQSLTQVTLRRVIEVGDGQWEDMNAYVDLRGGYASVQRTTYDEDGRVRTTKEVKANTTEKDLANSLIPANYQPPYAGTGILTIARGDHLAQKSDLTKNVSLTEYTSFNEGGQASAFKFTDYKADGSFNARRDFTKEYTLRDSFLEKKVIGTGVANSGSISPGNTFIDYDEQGHKTLLQDQNSLDMADISARRMLYAADGTLLRKEEGKITELNVQSTFTRDAYSLHITSNGNYLGEVGRTKKVNDTTPARYTDTLMAQHSAGMSQSEGSGVQSYQTQSGDTLASIALAFYGSSDYWYLIANRNGLSSTREAPIAAGQTLEVPSRATKVNSANSFKPMQLEQIIGDTTPGLPQLPPPPKVKCAAVTTVITVAITTILSPFLTPAGAAVVANFVGQTFSAVANGQFDFGGFIKGNLNPLNMAKRALAMANPLAGAYALNRALKGDDEYQALFNPFEYGFDYDYKSMAIAGASAYIGGQAGEFIGANAGWAGQYGAKVAAMGQAAVSFTAGVKLSQLSGNKDATFSFRSFAASVVSAGLFADSGKYVKPTQSSLVMAKEFNWAAFRDSFLSKESLTNAGMKVVTASTEHVLLKLMGDKKTEFDFKNVMLDAFGNMLGGAVVKGLTTKTDAQLKLEKKQAEEAQLRELARQKEIERQKEMIELQGKISNSLNAESDKIARATDSQIKKSAGDAIGKIIAEDETGAKLEKSVAEKLEKSSAELANNWQKRADKELKAKVESLNKLNRDLVALDARVAQNEKYRVGKRSEYGIATVGDLDGKSYEELERLRNGLIDASTNDGYEVNNALKEIGTQMDKVRPKNEFSRESILMGALNVRYRQSQQNTAHNMVVAAGYGTGIYAVGRWGLAKTLGRIGNVSDGMAFINVFTGNGELSDYVGLATMTYGKAMTAAMKKSGLILEVWKFLIQ